jgi:predicted CXXCH cytochrome family protein
MQWMNVRTRVLSLLMLLFAVAAASGAALVLSGTARAEVNQDTGASQSCLGCHKSKGLSWTFPSGETMSLAVDTAILKQSVHGTFECQTCHGNLPVPHTTTTAKSLAEYRLAALDTCHTCHTSQADSVKSSVHASLEIPGFTCLDCHGVHNIEPAHADTLRATTLQLCISCHQNEKLMKKHGLSTTVVSTYLKDFHGRTSTLLAKSGQNASIEEAVCIDCHGVHKIVKTDSPESQVIRANLTATCRKCHQDATPNFPNSWMSHYPPTLEKTPIVFAARSFYWLMIPFTVLGLVIHISIDIRQRTKGRGKAREDD